MSAPSSSSSCSSSSSANNHHLLSPTTRVSTERTRQQKGVFAPQVVNRAVARRYLVAAVHGGAAVIHRAKVLFPSSGEAKSQM